jgi:hypothetical protein
VWTPGGPSLLLLRAVNVAREAPSRLDIVGRESRREVDRQDGPGQAFHADYLRDTLKLTKAKAQAATPTSAGRPPRVLLQ